MCRDKGIRVSTKVVTFANYLIRTVLPPLKAVTQTQSFTLNVANAAPVVVAGNNQTIDEAGAIA